MAEAVVALLERQKGTLSAEAQDLCRGRGATHVTIADVNTVHGAAAAHMVSAERLAVQANVARSVAGSVEGARASRARRPAVATERVDKGPAAAEASRTGRDWLLVVLVVVVVAGAPASAGGRAVAGRAAVRALAALVLELGPELLVLVPTLTAEPAKEEANDEGEDEEAANDCTSNDERASERRELSRLAAGSSNGA